MAASIAVRVTPNARVNKIEETGENSYRIRVMAPAVEGAANKAVVKLLARHLGCRKSALRLICGEHSRDKVFEII